MAYGLKFDGGNDYTTSNPWNPTTLDFSFGIEFIAGSVTRNIMDSTYSNGVYVRVDNASNVVYVWYNGTRIYTGYPTYVFTEGETYKIEVFIHLDGSGEVFINDVLFSSASVGTVSLGVTSAPFTISRTSYSPSSFSDFTLTSAWLTDNNTPSNSRFYDPNSSDHGSGTVALTDTISGNTAQGVGMPTDGSAWVNLGGSEPISIGINGFSVNPTISIASIVPVGIIKNNGLSVGPSVSTAVVENITNLSINGLSVNPEIGIASVVNIEPVILTGLKTDPSIDNLTIESLGNIGLNGLFTQPIVGTVRIVNSGDVSNYSLSVTPGVGLLSIEPIKTINASGISTNVSIGTLTVNSAVNIGTRALEVNPTIGTLTIENFTLLGFNGLTVNPSIDLLKLSASKMPEFTNDNVFLADSSIQYSIKDNSINYRTT